jgi:phage shock protein PspC (stress-responsive transcriptional regulator)
VGPEQNVKRIYKSRTDRMINGVCAGIAEYLGVDPVMIRVAFALLIFAGGAGIALYLLGMILIPAGPAPQAASGSPAPAPGSADAAAGASIPASGPGGMDPDAETGPFAAASAGAGAEQASTPAQSEKAPSSDSAAKIIGIGFVVLGGMLLLGNLGIGWPHWWDLSWSTLAPLIIIAAGVALIARSQSAGSRGSGQDRAGAAAGHELGFEIPEGRLYRARMDRKFLGICGGLGAYLAVDPTILRVLLVISAFASLGATLLLYVVSAIIIPAEPIQAKPA